MKLIQIILLVPLLLLHYCYANIDQLREKFEDEKINFPQGDIHDVAYIQSILDYMYQIDQQVRVEYLTYLQSHDFNKEDSMHHDIKELMHDITLFHSSIMKHILAVHGWVTISKFGHIADHQAWLLIQHHEDPFFQAGCLFVLSNLVDIGETNRQNYAYLYDRVILYFPMLGCKQRYGTQFVMNSDHDIMLYPYEGTLQEIDERREHMGITQSVEEYIQLLAAVYKKNNYDA